MRSRALAVVLTSLVVASCGGDPVVPVDATPDADLTDALDLVPPDTMITSAPALLTNDPTPTFEFSANETSTFKCRLDGGVQAPCTSPVNLPALIDGSHTYEVIAFDTSNLEDPSPASHTWEIDTRAPETEILESPPATDNSTSARITFQSPGEPAATFECGLDGAAFAVCASPFIADNLQDGNHVFRVRAKDPAGNVDPTPQLANWVVDTLSPDTVIDTGPQDTVAATSATFTFSSPNAGAGATFACHLDAAPFGPCNSPRTFVGLNDGQHTFEVRVTNDLGSTDPSPARRVWTVDSTGPTTSITVRPDNPSADTTPTFEFTANEPATFECQIDGQVPYALCVSPYTPAALPGGIRFFRIRATDTVGNRGPEATYEWVLDVGGPTVVITAGPSGPVANTSATFNWNSTEPSTFCYRFTDDPADTCTMALAGSGTVTRPGLAQGAQTFTVTATDGLGNAGPPAVRNFSVDTVGPPVMITAGPMNTVGTISNSFTFTSTEPSTFCHRLDALGELCTATPAMSATVSVSANDGAHTLAVVARDALTNRTAVPATRDWTVDTVRPTTTIVAAPDQGDTLDTGDAMVMIGASEASTICWRVNGGAETCSAAGEVAFTAALAGLAEGPVAFTARSSDAIGPGPTVTRNWIVDTIRPTVVINAGPADGSTVGSSEATFTVVASERSSICWQFNTLGEQCSPAGVVNFNPAQAGLPEGANTFTVFARDAIDDGPMVTVTWTIDSIRPTLTITAGPANGSTSPDSVTNFTVDSSEPATICWRFNGGAEDCSAAGAMTASPTSAALLDGAASFVVYASDTIGTGPALLRSWTIDSLRPTVAISAGPADGSTLGTTSASFTLVASERSTICWQFNGGAAVCTGAGQRNAVATATGLPAGATSFSVTAADAVGPGNATVRNWTVDTVRPTVTITAGPTEGQRLDAVATTVSASSSEPATICSRVDGAAETCSAAGANSRDLMLADLTQGSHSVALYARDLVGVGATVTRSFIVDSIRPVVTITAGPAEGAGLNSTTANFQVVSSEPSTICWKFNGAAETCSAAGVVSAAPSANGLPQGATTFEVYARDATVNVFGATVTRTFTIDTVRPTVTITVGPAQGSISGNANTSFTVTSNEAATFCWRINNGVPTCSAGNLMMTSVLTGNLPNGGATFAVEARDLVGPGTTVVRNWVIDTIRPTVTITAGPLQNELVDSNAVDFTLHATEPSQLCWTFNADMEVCSPPGQVDVHALRAGLSDGLNTITFRAQDGVGFGPIGTRQWTIDTTPPVVTISAPPAEGVTTNLTTADFAITSNEPAQLCWRLEVGPTTCTPGAPDLVMMTSANLVNLTEGAHTLTVVANDLLLNESTTTRSWTIDLTAPVLTISGLPADNDNTPDEDFNVGLDTDEDATICWRFDSNLPGDFTCNAPPPTRTVDFDLLGLDNGSHTLDVTATDLAGNVTAETRHWQVVGNAVAPTILSVTPADAAASVAENATLAITFSIPMNPASLTFKSALDANACAGSIQLSTDNFTTCVPFSAKVMSNADATVTLTPAPGWSFGSTFKARVTTAAQAADATPLAVEFTQANGFTTRLSPASGTGVVISEIYGAGGNAGATYLNDFVVLHNRGTSSVDVSNWSVQYQSDNSAVWTANALPAAQSIPAGGYYLVKLASGGAVGAALPTADATPAGGDNLSAAQGKVALVNAAGALANGCPLPAAVVDLVGYGVSAMPCFEGAAVAPAPADATKSVQRKQVGCVDDNVNSTDFIATAAVDPRNATGPGAIGLNNICRPTHNEGGDGFEFDYCKTLTAGFSVATGVNISLAGEVFEVGLTQGVPGASARITAQVGYGPRNTNPEWQNAGWVFTAANFTGDGGGNNDGYSLTFAAPAVGDYSYAYRFSMDGGFNWTYCDENGAGSDPNLTFETTRLPLLHVTP